MADKEIEFLRRLGECADKEQAQRLIEEHNRAKEILADTESTRIIDGVARTPRILVLVLDRDEVQALINDTMFYMEHLAIREGMCVRGAFGLREHLLQKLKAFEWQLSGRVEEYYDT